MKAFKHLTFKSNDADLILELNINFVYWVKVLKNK